MYVDVLYIYAASYSLLSENMELCFSSVNILACVPAETGSFHPYGLVKPYGLDSNVARLLVNLFTKPVVFHYFPNCIYWSCFLFQLQNIIIIQYKYILTR